MDSGPKSDYNNDLRACVSDEVWELAESVGSFSWLPVYLIRLWDPLRKHTHTLGNARRLGRLRISPERGWDVCPAPSPSSEQPSTLG